MTTDQQAVEKTALHIPLFHPSNQLHVVLRIDVISLQLHLDLQAIVRLRNSLPHDFSKRPNQIDLSLINTVPFILCIADLQDLPIL